MAEDDKTQDVEARESSVLSDILQLSGPCAPKEATVDPYVKVRCGKHTIWEQTQPVKNGGATPTWTTTHKNEVQLVRHGTDQGAIHFEVWSKDKYSRDDFMGGGVCTIAKYMDSPNEEITDKVGLYEKGVRWKKHDKLYQGDGSHTGTLNVTIKWVPDEDEDEGGGRKHTKKRKKKQMKNSAGVVIPPGVFIVTCLSGEDLRHPETIIRDLSTFVDFTAVKISIVAIFVYLLVSFMFFALYMVSDDAEHPDGRVQDVLDRVHGGNGDWTAANTLVFLVTSFTTVGFGNHPSLVRTPPPCQYPSQATRTDDPWSVLLPEDQRPEENEIVSGMQGYITQEQPDDREPEFVQPKELCFDSDWGTEKKISDDPSCWVVSDEHSIFDFGKLLSYQRHWSPSANYSEPQRRNEIQTLELPGRFTLEELEVAPQGPEIFNNTGLVTSWRKDAFNKYKAKCDFVLDIWRHEETKKDHAKAFTIIFIICGIGLLGLAVGALGDEVMSAVKKLFSNVEMALDAVTMEAAAGSDTKGIIVATVVMMLLLLVGTITYSQLEQLRMLDALYFTVVTATTVGFGDYVPTSFASKAFTLAYVPIAVTVVAGAINHIGAVPLHKRQRVLENFVLAQFGSNMTISDFEDIRRSVGLGNDDKITSNDFLLAMLMRLGRILPEDVVKCRRLFSKLDRDHNLELDDNDIKDLLRHKPNTAKIDDHEFDLTDHDVVDHKEDPTDDPKFKKKKKKKKQTKDGAEKKGKKNKKHKKSAKSPKSPQIESSNPTFDTDGVDL